MREFGIPSGVLYSEFARFARGYKSVGFRSACIDSSIIRNSERLIATRNRFGIIRSTQPTETTS